ncbi:signal peptidase II [Gracilimonas halophila]|uniref:Lipoprotein signal peptidase n=1 Tax=Gracilimonas halophila TaxID=1834464 RepID=A0ABW5JIT1_9BACT
MNKQKLTAIFVPAFIVLALDQLTKWLIRTSPELQNKVLIEGWLQFYYTKNPGMALGIDVFSTPVISVIAILAVSGILFYIIKNIEEATIGYLFCMGLIIGGAFGNISDRLFMGLIMDYGGVLEGHVVDFIYFSLQIGDWTVFPYIFNVADVAISCSIIFILIFNRRFFITQNGESETEESVTESEVKTDSTLN